MPITVLLSDDKEVMRSSIRLLLDSDAGIRIVGEAANFQQTIQRPVRLACESARNQVAVR